MRNFRSNLKEIPKGAKELLLQKMCIQVTNEGGIELVDREVKTPLLSSFRKHEYYEYVPTTVEDEHVKQLLDCIDVKDPLQQNYEAMRDLTWSLVDYVIQRNNRQTILNI